MLCVLVDNLYKSSYVVFAFHQDEICKTFWHVYSTEWTVTNRIIFFLRNSKKNARAECNQMKMCVYLVYLHTYIWPEICDFLLGSTWWPVIARKCFCSTSNFGNLAAMFTSLIWSLLKVGSLNLNDPFCFLKLPFIRTSHGWSQSPVNSCF